MTAPAAATDELVPWHERPAAWRALYCGALLVLGAVTWGRINDLGLTTVSRVCVLLCLGLLVVSVAAAPTHLLGASSVFLAVLFVFHFGLLVLVSLGIDPVRPALVGLAAWFIESPELVEAVLLTTAGYIAACLGVAIAHSARRVPHLPESWVTYRPDPMRAAATVLGNAMVTAFVAAWFALGIVRGGAGVYLGSYAEFRTVTEGFTLPFVYFGIAAGLLLMAASGWDRRHWIGLGAFVAFAIAALAVGVRTETLLPIAAAVAVFVRAGRLPRARVVIVVALIGLSLISAVRSFRQIGLTDVDPGQVSLNPLEAFVELGSGLRPVLVVLDWRSEGEPYLWGLSYWAPVERQLARFVPGLDRPPADEDERLLNVAVSNRIGAIGFSMIAEAHRNFAVPGIVAVLALFGYLAGSFDRWRPSPLANAVMGFSLLHLLRHVRNSFAPVPLEIALSLVVLAVLWLLVRLAGPVAAVPPPEQQLTR